MVRQPLPPSPGDAAPVKDAVWRQVVTPLVPEHWAVRGKVAWRQPAGPVVVGLLGEDSGLDTGVYLWRLLLPLFVPTDVWDLSWSTRLGGGARTWSIDALPQPVSESVARAPADHDALRALAKRRSADNWQMLEAVAGSRVLLGRRKAALRVVRGALDDPVAASAPAATARLARLRDQLSAGDLAAARSDLEARARTSAAALGLG
jgi:hypothetical protein